MNISLSAHVRDYSYNLRIETNSSSKGYLLQFNSRKYSILPEHKTKCAMVMINSYLACNQYFHLYLQPLHLFHLSLNLFLLIMHKATLISHQIYYSMSFKWWDHAYLALFILCTSELVSKGICKSTSLYYNACVHVTNLCWLWAGSCYHHNMQRTSLVSLGKRHFY